MVNKITSPITPLGEIDKINEVIDQVNTNTTDISGKQATLVSGTNIKTINNTSLLGSGDISIPTGVTTTVKINGTSITSSGVADIKTNGTYNATSNKIATMSDVPAEQVQSNWTETNISSKAYIQNKPSLATVATSGSYNDLSNKPTIPTVNNATLTITQDGTTKGTFTANASSDVTINLDAGGGASRNIGEIIPSVIPLTDAGLHLLDGSLIQGGGAYSDFVDYIGNLYAESSSANYFAQPQTIRTFNYEKAGTASTAIIEDNGILSGFTGTTAYVTAPAQTPSTSMELVIKVKQNTLTANQSLIESATSTHGIVLRVTNASTGLISAWMGAGSWFISGANTGLYLTAGLWTYIKVTWDGSTYNFYQSSDGSNWTTGTPQTGKTTAPDLNDGLRLGGTSWESYPFANGQIDLNGCYFKRNNTMIWQGYTDTDYTAEQMWERAVTAHGVCGKFVYDSVNNTVRLPKYSNKIHTSDISSTAPVVGNGLGLGTTNGTLERNIYVNANGIMVNGFETRTPIGTTGTAAAGFATSQSIGVSKDPNNSGLIAQLSNITMPLDGYYYIVVATITKTDIEVDIDEIATDLNGKMDVDMSNMNASSLAKKTVDSWGCPDWSSGISMGLPTYPLSTTTTTFTCPSAGIGKFWLLRSSAGYNIEIYVNNISIWSASALSAFGLTALIPLSKNDVVLVKTNGTSNTWEVATAFYPLKGEV